ncbi:3854_t:CDS:10, partial [Acaulospora morrowiae]
YIPQSTEIDTCSQFMCIPIYRGLVRHATARVISAIGKIELPAGTWNELLQFLYQCCQSQIVGQREVGIFVIFSLLEVTDVFIDNLHQLLQMFGAALNDPESKNVRVTSLEALGKVAEFIEPDNKEDIKMYRDLIPSMINVLQQCLNDGDVESALKGFELFDTLLLLETPFLSIHLPQLIDFVLSVARNTKYDKSIRVMALQFVIWVAAYKKAKIQKLKLVGPIIQQLMPIGTEDDPDDVDDESPSKMTFRVINSLSTKLPPQQIFPVVMEYVTAYVQNPDPRYRKAGIMAFAVLIEGCADFMRSRFDNLLPLVCNGLHDPEVIVRKGACIALCCLAEELEQEIAAKHAVLLPLIFELINDSNVEIQKQACNALDAILEGLGDEILQYLPILMEKLLVLLDNSAHEVKATVVSAIGSAAHASGEEFRPYFPHVISRLQLLMSQNKTNDDFLLRGIATDTVGAVAESVGKEVIQPYANEIMRLAIEGSQMDSARLRECSYCLFAVFSRVFKDEFSPYLTTIMPQLIKSCQMEEQDLFDAEVNSAIADEKEIAADVIGEIFENIRSHFLPYVDTTLQELIKLSDHHSDGVRKSVIGSLFQFLVTFYNMSNPVQWQPGLPLKVPVHENVINMAKAVIPTILTAWEDERSKILVHVSVFVAFTLLNNVFKFMIRMVVVRVCAEFAEAIKTCGPLVVADHLKQICDNVLLLYQKKAACQEDDADEDGFLDEDDEAEYDELLISSASDLVSALASAMGPDFVPFFKEYIQYITKYYKKTRSISDRSMAIGCLGESTVGLKSGITEFTQQLLPIYLKALEDEEEEVRSNAAYAVGLLCQYTNVDISGQYSSILSRLSLLFTNQSSTNVTDNACGAVCRMIMACPHVVPVDQVLEAVLRVLPLKKDHEENEPVFQCIFMLFRANNSFVFNHIPELLNIFAQVLSPPEDQLKEQTRQELIELIKALNQQFPDVVARSSLGAFLQA